MAAILRRCPACGLAFRSGDFVIPGGGARRKCPGCGHQSATKDFPVVRSALGRGR